MQSQIDKKRVASSFSKAAATYDGASLLQRDVGNELIDIVQSYDNQLPKAGRVVDLGSGTGYFTERLADLLEPEQLIGLDIAQGMLEYSKQHKRPSIQWLCADAESLPLADNSIDILFSSLAIQWCETPSLLFSELERVLVKGGCAFLSTLGPDSLFELRNAWSSIDQNMHVNNFIGSDDLLSEMPESMALFLSKRDVRVIEYNKLNELTSDLKNIGAHNMNAGESKGLTGRAKITQFKSNYELYRQQNGMLPASYEVYYLAIKKRH